MNIYMTERDKEMSVLHESGMTFNQIGQHFGVSRERVSQCLSRAAPDRIRRRNNARGIDPLALLRAIRASSICNLVEACEIVGCREGQARSTLRALGMASAVHRLFRARRAKRSDTRRKGECIEKLRQLVDPNGTPLSGNQIQRKYPALHGAIYKYFPSIQAAREAAGVAIVNHKAKAYRRVA